jgi:hypothetical protein
MSEKITAVFNPQSGRIACVLLQAAYGCDNRAAMLFDTSDWILAPESGLVKMTDTLENWRRVAGMKVKERIGLFQKPRRNG